MSEQPIEDPFDDCELAADAILGMQTFETSCSLTNPRCP